MDLYTPEKRGWGHYFKMCALYIALIAGALLLYFVVTYAVQFYETQSLAGRVAATADALKQAQDADYAKAMADTYGGTTPQETLQMYISAVEKGDYVLASKYFIADKQAGELKSLNSSPKKNIDNIVGLLKQDLNSTGSYSANKTEFAIEKPLLADFKQYPNGVWKIIEI